MIEETICLQCGSIGYENAFVYCIRCLNFAVHRYCLDEIPETFDEIVRWLCDDCKVTVQKQDANPNQTIHHEVSENIKGFSRNGKKNDGLMVVEANCDSAKSELLDCGELATPHVSVESDGKDDENAIVLPVDVTKISQQSSSLHLLEEDGVEGSLIDSKLNKDKFTNKNKRKRNATESTIEEDVHRRATASYEERVKADINERTGLVIDSTLPSEVKENGSSEKKDEERKKKKRRKIKKRYSNGRRKKKGCIAESTAQKEHHIHASASFEECAKVDITACKIPVSDSTLASKVKENGPSEKKDEEKKIKNTKKRKGSRNRKRKRKRKNQRNIVESNIEKDQHRLATASSLKCLTIGINKCTRSTTDSIIPSEVQEKGLPEQRDIENKKNIEDSITEKDEQRLATTSYDERVKEDINECTLSEVKENGCSEKKDQTCITKPFDSITDLGTTSVPADDPAISSDEPSKLSEQKKTITSSETISQDQVLQNGVAQPLDADKRLCLQNECAALSTEEKDLVSSNDPIENRGPEDKEEQASTSCRSMISCKYYPNEIGFSVAEPIAMPIWRGRLNIWNPKYEDIDELIAHISSKACYKVYEAASQFQPVLRAEMLPKSDIWPKSFQKVEPNGDSIALYFFPSKISKQVFEQLVEEMIREELAFRALVQNAELLIFTSTELPLRYWRFRNKYYLWGVFRAKQANPLSSIEVPSIRKRCDDRSLISPLIDSANNVENNENLT